MGYAARMKRERKTTFTSITDPMFAVNVLNNRRSWYNDERFLAVVIRRMVVEFGYDGKVSDTYDERGEYTFRVPMSEFGPDVERTLELIKAENEKLVGQERYDR